MVCVFCADVSVSEGVIVCDDVIVTLVSSQSDSGFEPRFKKRLNSSLFI